MTSQFVPTATNMVASVTNIIQGYDMGPIRALAQEPVQNAKDAARGKQKAHIEYRLHRRPTANGTLGYMLTVTDSNTSGLGGPVLSLEEIEKKGNVLSIGDNWAAFEGMGYTKDDDYALGSRGQGKAAFLYHSQLPHTQSSGLDRMMILYDTLLPDGVYRLGVRYANPNDTVLKTPFTGEEARSTVSSHYGTNDGLNIELGLEPLSSVGTRVIVPHLSVEATKAIQSGELYQWLQRCWWRAVQTGLTIKIVDEWGKTETVEVPLWWQDEPWKNPGERVRVYDGIEVAGGLKIKRIVLLYDDSKDGPDFESASPQFWGVQLLRGQQWIETLDQEITDYIPRDKRSGFHGFVEFDRGTEPVLRRAEKPQHEKFDRRASGIKTLISAIVDRVKEFAEEQGWTPQESARPAPGEEAAAALEFLHFLSPNTRSQSRNGSVSSDPNQLKTVVPDADRWECDLLMKFPDPNFARADWGQHIRNVETIVKLDPPKFLERATVSLELSMPGDKASVVTVARQEIELREGNGVAQFGEYQVITGRSSEGKLQCARSGKYRLTAIVQSRGAQVARASRTFYVKEDPPTYETKPYSLSISAENHTTQERRINSGNTVGVQISVTNRTAKSQTLALSASWGDFLLCDMKQKQVKGSPPGASPTRVAGFQTDIVVNPTEPTTKLSVNMPPGKHYLRADLYLEGEVVAHASRTLYVDVAPVQPDDWPPFGIERIHGKGHYPRWRFINQSQDDWILQYPPAYPLYRALEATPARRAKQLSGVSAFVVDVCAEGLIEWALVPLEDGDSSRLDVLLGGTPVGADPDRWEDYCEKIRELESLRSSREQVDKYGLLARECAALSLNLFEEQK